MFATEQSNLKTLAAMGFEDLMIEDGYSDEASYFDHLMNDYLDDYEQEPEDEYYDDEPYDDDEYVEE